MFYVVEIKREREHLAQIMSGIREWLDRRRFEPNTFRCTTDEQTATFHLEFKAKVEAMACAEAFGGEVS